MKIPLPPISGPARASGALGAFVSGLLLSLVLAPCGTPVLASVLSFAAYKQSAAYGGTLLFAYGVGVGLPILVLGAAATGLARRLDGLGWRTWVDRVAGGVLVGLGFYLLWVA
jgi:cytochrome c biogenesis protein CcdA